MKKKKITLFFIAVFTALSATAADLDIIVPWNTGTLTDTVIRKVEAAYEKNTGRSLAVHNISGAQGVLGVRNWMQSNGDYLVATTASTNIFNYIDKNIIVPYSEQDFNHVLYLGTMPGLWVTRSGTKIITPQDLINHMPRLVGGYAPNWNSNHHVLVKEFGLNSEIVDYRSSNQMIVDLMGGILDLVITAPSPLVSDLIAQGKLQVVGTTYHMPVKINGIMIESVSARLNVMQFNGFIGIATKPGSAQQQLHHDLWQAIQDPSVTSTMNTFGMIPDSTNDITKIKSKLSHVQKQARKYLLD